MKWNKCSSWCHARKVGSPRDNRENVRSVRSLYYLADYRLSRIAVRALVDVRSSPCVGGKVYVVGEDRRPYSSSPFSLYKSVVPSQ